MWSCKSESVTCRYLNQEQLERVRNQDGLGLCLLIHEEGLPFTDAFAFDSFEEIEEEVNTTTISPKNILYMYIILRY